MFAEEIFVNFCFCVQLSERLTFPFKISITLPFKTQVEPDTLSVGLEMKAVKLYYRNIYQETITHSIHSLHRNGLCVFHQQDSMVGRQQEQNTNNQKISHSCLAKFLNLIPCALESMEGDCVCMYVLVFMYAHTCECVPV